MVLFARQNEWKKIKGCMRIRKIGVCEVMKDKEMEDRPHHRDDQCALKERCEERIHDVEWLYG